MYKNDNDWWKAVTVAQNLIMVNSFEQSGKEKLLQTVADCLNQRTDALVKIHDLGSDGPYLTAELSMADPSFTLLLQGHLDTVSPEGMVDPFSPTITAGRLRGLGSADMKGGCGALLAAFEAAALRDRRKGKIILAFSTDEEYRAADMGRALEKGHIPKCDLGIIAEPSDDRINVAHRGNSWVKVNFHGRSAHASSPDDGVNAIYMAAAFACELKKHLKTAYLTIEDSLCGHPCVNLGVISGGTLANVVPQRATLTLDRRGIPGETIDDFIKEILGLFKKCKDDDPQFSADYEVILDLQPVCFPVESDIFKRICGAINKIRNKPIKHGVMSGWGEAGTFQRFGIPSLYYGPGSMSSAHTQTEDVSVDEITDVAKGIFNIIMETCF
jgi:acetylornithine deacetylase/succinyl-diaminopimelate desuccinylase-like protein